MRKVRKFRANLICLGLLLLNSTALAASEISFSRNIRPILAEHCLHCHGPDEDTLAAELRLDLESSSKKSVIIAGQPDQSPLIERLLTEDPERKMPPPETGKSLKPRRSTCCGGGSRRVLITKDIGPSNRFAIRRFQLPRLGINTIDRFIVSELEKRGLSLAPESIGNNLFAARPLI